MNNSEGHEPERRWVGGWKKPRHQGDILRKETVTLIIVLSSFVLCLLRLCGLVREAAVDLLFEDQWDFLTPAFNEEGAWACFSWQHGPHRQGLGGLIDWYLYRATNWDVRAESWLAILVLGLAAYGMVCLTARLRGGLHWSDAAYPFLLLNATHWETMLLTPNLAHSILPLLLVVGLAYAWTLNSSRWRLPLIVTLSAMCVFTGFAVCGAIATLGLCLLLLVVPQQGSDAWSNGEIVIVVGGTLAAFVVFSVGYVWQPAVPDWHFPVTPWWDYLRFVVLMFASLLGWREITFSSLLSGALLMSGGLLIVGNLAVALLRHEVAKHIYAECILVFTTVTYAVLTAVGRLPVNIEAAFMWRYSTLLLPGVCALGVVFARWARAIGIRAHALQCLWLGMAVIVWGNFVPDRNALATAAAKRSWIERYVRSGDLSRANAESGFWVYFPAPDSSALKLRLQYLKNHRLSFYRDAN